MYAAMRAPHRLMGLKLRVMIETTNVNPDPWDPFDTTLRTEVSIYQDSTSDRMGPGTQVIYSGSRNPSSVSPGTTLHTQPRGGGTVGGLDVATRATTAIARLRSAARSSLASAAAAAVRGLLAACVSL